MKKYNAEIHSQSAIEGLLEMMKEEAVYSLPFILAVAALDGKVMPAQYAEARIGRRDVQTLLRRVTVAPEPEFTERFPEVHACRITVQPGRRDRIVKAARQLEHLTVMEFTSLPG